MSGKISNASHSIWTLLVAPGLFCLAMIAMEAQCAADERPNIVVILCDDLGYGDLGCYGHPHIHTPHLDQLAEQGIRFTDFYSAAPVCSPARAGLLTGRNPNRAGIYDWIPPSDGTKKPDARERVHLRRDEVTLPAELGREGYTTFMAGKWHLSSRFNEPDIQPQPDDFGFDHWLAAAARAEPDHANPANFFRNGQPVGPRNQFSCLFNVEEAMRWLVQRREVELQTGEPGNPFFIYLPFHEPHEPVESPQVLVRQYSSVAKNENEAQYFANVTNIDLAVGRLLKQLEELQLVDNTMVVFTSDNGPETLDRYPGATRSYGRAGALQGMKLHTHEAGIRVPGIIRWPKRIKPGQTVSTPVSALDLMPTCCEVAGCKSPDAAMDGQTLLPLFDGQPLQRTKPLLWCFFHAINDGRIAMRDGQWKVLARLNSGELPRFQNVTPEIQRQLVAATLTDVELYDLEKDPSESENLAETRPELARELLEKLNGLYRELLDDSHVWEPGE